MANVIEVRVAAASDDAEQVLSTGNVSRSSSDLELSNDVEYTGPQTEGVRFAKVYIPQGAVITEAWIQFTAAALDAEPTTLTIRVQASANAWTFSSANSDISSRPTTVSTVSWTPDIWTDVGDHGMAQKTADISVLVQEVVSQAGWSAGNAMAFIFNGFGTRAACAFESGAELAPVLHIEYTLGGTNTQPTAANDSAVTAEDTTTAVTVLANDSDQDGDTLTLAGIGQPQHGVALLNSDGTISYTPTANWFGIDSLTYSISDRHGGLAQGTLSLTVTPVNDTPAAVDDLAVVTVDTPAVVKMLANDRDVEDDSLTISGVGAAQNGVVAAQPDGTILYVPNGGFTGVDKFTYSIADGHGGTDIATVTVHVEMGFDTVTFATFGDYGTADEDALSVVQLVKSKKPDFIVTLGDNTYGGLNTPDKAVGKYYFDYVGNYHGAYGPGSTTNRFFPALSEHDLTDGGGIYAYSSFFTIPESSSGNNRYYDFIRGPVQFFVMHTDPRESDGDDINSAQVRWLKRALMNSVTPWQVVIAGEPPFSSGTMHGSKPALQLPFEQWGVDAVLSGDEHNFERLLRDDNGDGMYLPYFVVGTGGADLYPFSKTPLASSVIRDNTDHGILLVTATDTDLTFNFWSVAGGAPLDSYTVHKSSAPAVRLQVAEVRINAGSDDAEELRSTGEMSLNSTDLELINDSGSWGKQTVGLRFSGLDVPAGATVTKAYIQFTVDERQKEATNLIVSAQASANATTFTSTSFNISARPTTTNTATWSPSAWATVGESGPAERTSDLSALVQEVISQPGWSAGNAIAFILDGEGHRTATAFETTAATAPMLHVEYSLLTTDTPTRLDLATTDDTGASQTDNVTSKASGLTISGKAEAGATVFLFDDANNDGIREDTEIMLRAVVASGGNFVTTISLAEGLHHVRAYTTDFGGNTSATSIALDLTIDTTAPARPESLELLIEDVTLKRTRVIVSGRADAGATVTVFNDVNDNGVLDKMDAVVGTAVAVDGSFSTNILLPVGPHHVRAFATDVAGNTGPASAAL